MSIHLHSAIARERRTKLRRCFFIGVATLLLSLLGACASVDTQSNSSTTRFAGDGALAPYFSLNGRISVRVNDKLDSGQVRWQRSESEERIGLFSPLGSQVAELLSDKKLHAATLRQGNETTSATSVMELTQSMLGIPLELDRLAEWVQGYGLRENEATDVALANGDVWRVTAERYQQQANFRFAARVVATRGDVVVRLVIDEWTPQ